HPVPLDFQFIGLYLLPARPPMMNISAAVFLAQVGEEYVVYQLVFLYLNALVVVPLCLLAPALLPKARRSVWLLVPLLALNPMFVQNLTYSWTRELTAFYV